MNKNKIDELISKIDSWERILFDLDCEIKQNYSLKLDLYIREIYTQILENEESVKILIYKLYRWGRLDVKDPLFLTKMQIMPIRLPMKLFSLPKAEEFIREAEKDKTATSWGVSRPLPHRASPLNSSSSLKVSRT